ncbi:MAG: efflux RND transporter periplasmic adaptor subunit [bacterium]
MHRLRKIVIPLLSILLALLSGCEWLKEKIPLPRGGEEVVITGHTSSPADLPTPSERVPAQAEGIKNPAVGGGMRASVSVERVRLRQMSEKISALGTVSFKSKVDISSKAMGRIESVLVEEGDEVNEGQVLARIERLPLELERRQREAELSSAKSALLLAEARYEIARQNVDRQLKIIAKAEADLEDKKASLDNISQVLENKKKLLEIGAITQENYDAVKTQHTTFYTKYILAQRDLEIQRMGYRDIDIKNEGYKVPDDPEKKLEILRRINTKVEAAEVAVAQSRVKDAEAALESLNILLSETTIKAPSKGMVAVKYMEPGEQVRQDSTILTIMDIDEVYIKANIAEKELREVKVGQKVRATLDAYPDESFEGDVHLINPLVDVKSRTAEVRVRIPNSDHRLKPGMFARVNIITENREKSPAVPQSAVLERKNPKSGLRETFVYVVKEGIAFIKPVEAGIESEGYVEILRGLKEGEVVVIGGHEGLQDQTPVDASEG